MPKHLTGSLTSTDGASVAVPDHAETNTTMITPNHISDERQVISTSALTIISAATLSGAAGAMLFGPAGAVGGAVLGIIGGAALAHSEGRRDTKPHE